MILKILGRVSHSLKYVLFLLFSSLSQLSRWSPLFLSLSVFFEYQWLGFWEKYTEVPCDKISTDGSTAGVVGRVGEQYRIWLFHSKGCGQEEYPEMYVAKEYLCRKK